MRKVVLSLFILIAAIGVLLGATFLYREDLVRYGAGRFLSGGQLTLLRLDGLQLTSTELKLAELEFLMNEAGQRLVIEGLDVDFRLTSFSTAPVVDSITIASARLAAAAAAEDTSGGEARAESGANTQLSDLLALLRGFPLAHVEIGALELPQYSQPLAFTLQRGEGQLDARAASGVLVLQAQFTQADAAAPAQVGITLTRADATVGDFTIALQPMGEVYALNGSGTLEVADLATLLGELEQAPLALPLKAARLDWTLAGSVADDLFGSVGRSGPETFTLGIGEGAAITLPAGLAAGLGEVMVEFTGGAQILVTSGAGLTVSSERIPLHAVTTRNAEALAVDAAFSLRNCELAASAACALGFEGNASFGAYTLAGALQVEAASGGNYRISTQNLTLGGLPPLVPPFDVDATVSVADARITFATPLLLRRAPSEARIALTGTYDLAAAAADVHVTLPELRLDEQGGALSAWFGNWPYAFDVLTGSIAAELDLHWQAGALTGALDGKLNALGGFYGDYFFRGLDGPLHATIDTAGELPLELPVTTLRVAGLDVGLTLENIELAFSLERAGLLHIDSIVAHVLEGTVSGMDITYDFNRERNDVLVSFDGLRMERMLDLVDYEGIEAIGAVSGKVPLTITPNGVEVAEGILTADAPGGSIRYLAAANGATGNAGLDLVNQALGNYQFDSLTSDIDYKPDGELVLAMKLQGRNPDMSGGQRINLNLNLSDNIPALLESLQAAREIEDFLADQYQ